MKSKVLEKIKNLWSIFGTFKHMSIVLFVLMVAAALCEGFGLWMIVPLLEFILRENAPTTSFRFFTSIFEIIPQSYRFMAICTTNLQILLF